MTHRSFLEQRLHPLSLAPQSKKVFTIDDVIRKLLQSNTVREETFNMPWLKEAVLPHLRESENQSLWILNRL